MKTVKIFFEKALTLLLMVIGAVSLASCGDDDDVTEPTATVKKVEIIVNIEPTQDMLDYCKNNSCVYRRFWTEPSII